MPAWVLVPTLSFLSRLSVRHFGVQEQAGCGTGAATDAAVNSKSIATSPSCIGAPVLFILNLSVNDVGIINPGSLCRARQNVWRSEPSPKAAPKATATPSWRAPKFPVQAGWPRAPSRL